MTSENQHQHKIIGIDLGTTISCMCGILNGKLQILDNKDGERLTPSVVCFNKTGGNPVVGTNAVTAGRDNPMNFVYEVKRMLGKGINDSNIQKAVKYWPFKIKQIGNSVSETDNIGIVVTENGKEKVYEPIEISSFVLGYLLDSAKQKMGVYPDYAVITKPAYFSDIADKRTLDAARIAFESRRLKEMEKNNCKIPESKILLMKEPSAAALAYAVNKLEDKNFMRAVQEKRIPDTERVMVFDLGGGTFDVCIVDFSYDIESPGGDPSCTDGDAFLGGADFDNVIMKIAREEFVRQYKYDPFDAVKDVEQRKKMELRLRSEAIKTKIALSANPNVKFILPCFHEVNDLSFELSATYFYREARELFDKLVVKMRGSLLASQGLTVIYRNDGTLDVPGTLKASNMNPNEDIMKIQANAMKLIEKVILVGGSSRIPKVKAVVAEFFGEVLDASGEPVLKMLVDTYEAKLSKDEVERARKSKKICTPINPDESIAFGAGFYANLKNPELDEFGAAIGCSEAAANMLIIESVPLNLSIETFGGVSSVLIPANSRIPCTEKQDFTTAEDNQTSVQIKVFQGNRGIAKENFLIGEFTLSGIPPAPRGVPRIAVTFKVNDSGVLVVTANESSSGISNEISINDSNNRFTKEKITELVEQAAKFSKQDEERVELVRVRSTYENAIYSIEDKLNTLTIPEEEKENIKNRIKDEISWIRSNECENSTAAVVQQRMTDVLAELQKMMGGPTDNNAANNFNVDGTN